jgi:replicative DNA helicase
MSVERVHERVLAIEGRTRVDDLRNGLLDDVARAAVGAAAVRLRGTLPYVELMPTNVQVLATQVAAIPQVELVVIDSLQSLAGGPRELEEELAATIRGLKALALNQRVAILTTSQLPNLDARQDRRPTLDDFGALGGVKHHADVVLALYREEMYQSARDIAGATELHVRKNRNGGTGYIDLFFYTQWMRFEDMLDPDR